LPRAPRSVFWHPTGEPSCDFSAGWSRSRAVRLRLGRG
jgi:hypothetical protein